MNEIKSLLTMDSILENRLKDEGIIKIKQFLDKNPSVENFLLCRTGTPKV